MPTIIYHGGCFDGFGAAWIANNYFHKCNFIPCEYRKQPVPDVKDSDVYILDYSFPREDMIRLNEQNTLLKVLDHHKTAQAACEGLDFCTFDMNRSGAGMTWDYLYPDKPRPALINYVEDRDLWRFALPKAKEIDAYIASFPKDFTTWNQIYIELESSFDFCVTEGEAILRYQDQKIEEIAEQVNPNMVIAGHKVPLVNCTYQFASDALHTILEKYPEAPFASSFYFGGDGKLVRFSLRGRGDFDVSDIAKKFGGGGHKNAAGFELTPKQFAEMFIND